MAAYASQQSVLEEAGLWHRELATTPAGATNGANTVFTVDHKPLADNNYDDTVDATDVTAYVGGTAVAVTAVNETTGAITLAVAPGAATDVTIDHSYSSVSGTDVEEVLEEAGEWADDELEEVHVIDPSAVPKQVRMLTRLYAASILMIRFFGLQNNEEQVDSGYAKLKLAKKLMADYRARQVANGVDSGTIAVPITTPRVRLFQKYNSENSRWDSLADENFTVNRES